MTPQKILVVDDEAFIADLSRMVLGDIGHEVFCAYSGEQAVEKAMTDHFDLAILDALLPGMTGIETFEAIRHIIPTISGVLVSGHPTADMVREAMDKGFSAVLQKPVGSTELVHVVQETLLAVEES